MNSSFFTEMDFTSDRDVIRFLCDRLMEAGCCDEEFYDKVIERERIAPTAYGNLFAIPHPIEKCAFRNAVAVCTPKHPIVWQSKKVRIIFLFSLCPGHNRDFEDIFEQLVSLLNDVSNVKLLLRQTTLSGFLGYLQLTLAICLYNSESCNLHPDNRLNCCVNVSSACTIALHPAISQPA